MESIDRCPPESREVTAGQRGPHFRITVIYNQLRVKDLLIAAAP